MRVRVWTCAFGLASVLAAASVQAATGVRVVMGLGDKLGVDWSGSVEIRGGSLRALEGWRFDSGDAIQPGGLWKCSIHAVRLRGAAGAANTPVANGVILWVDGETAATEVSVKTAQGSFSLPLAALPYGTAVRRLGGRVMADRVPDSRRIASSANEQDYPAVAAGLSGEVWLAWIEFLHHPGHMRLSAGFTKAPERFDDYAAPTGGDRVMAARFASGKWDAPIAITPAGLDAYRPAVAVDGKGRPWVFWSASGEGNFDLFARVVDGGQPGRTVRLTRDAGADIMPVAATDSRGRVWVAWQGWRGGRAAIFCSVQNGDGFSAPTAISSSAANEWNPAIAADGAGRVSVAWDSYRNGNYDVYLRTATAPGAWGSERPAAASARYEAYPSLAYDKAGRLWVAYEEGGERWGKDFGTHDTTGLSLYQGRAIRLRVLDAAGRWSSPADIGGAMPGLPEVAVESAARQSDLEGWQKPDPGIVTKRAPNRYPDDVRAPYNSMPRIAADASGRIWVAARSPHPRRWSSIGFVWSEWIASLDEKGWTGPVFVAHSDNILDNRPALIGTVPGELLVVGSADGRRAYPPPAAAPGSDAYRNELYAGTIALRPAAAPIPAAPASVPVVSGVEAPDRAERAAIAMLRNARIASREGPLRVARGEFHRHSEMSFDGGEDGSLIDQWRYAIDTAAMDWVGCCDHDNGGLREYSWWTTQKLTDVFHEAGRFISMFSYERSVSYPEGHRNTVFAQRGVRPLPRLPKVADDSTGNAPDTRMFYRYLRQFNGIVASHTSGTTMGTDWRDHDPQIEPVVEIYQGTRQSYEMPGAPRGIVENDALGGYRPKGFINLALEKGYMLAFQASSDHISTHQSYCNILTRDLSREAILDAFRKRHVYGATDNILADYRSGEHIMGDSFTTATPPVLKVKLTGTAPFARVHVIKDNRYVYSIEPGRAAVEFTWRDNQVQAGKKSYYYVRGEQADSNIVWVSPMWITYQP